MVEIFILIKTAQEIHLQVTKLNAIKAHVWCSILQCLMRRLIATGTDFLVQN